MNRLFRAVLLVATALVAVGCGQPELIDRTQPNFIKKSDLDGVWYIQESIIDAPKTPSGVTTVGYGGKMEKIRWEIQEDLLVGYRSYEIVPGRRPARRSREVEARPGRLQGRPPLQGQPGLRLQDPEPLRSPAPVQRGDRRAEQRARRRHG